MADPMCFNVISLKKIKEKQKLNYKDMKKIIFGIYKQLQKKKEKRKKKKEKKKKKKKKKTLNYK
jgi:hypothetical protein